MLWKLREAWERDPDMRLGQLIANAARDNRGEIRDIFSIEDTTLENGLDRLRGADESGSSDGI